MRSIRIKILAIMIVSLFLFGGIISWIFISQSSTILEHQAINELKEKTESVGEKINTQNRIIETAVHSEGMLLVVNGFNYEKGEENASYLQQKLNESSQLVNDTLIHLHNKGVNAIGIYIQYEVHTFHGMYENWYVWENGTSVRQPPEPIESYNASDSNLSWYYEPLSKKISVWTDTYEDVNIHVPMISYVEPFFTADGRPIGVAGIDLSLGDIKTFISSIKMYNTGYVFFMDRANNFIVEPKTEINRSLIEKLMNEKKKKPDGIIEDNTSMLYYVTLPSQQVVASYVLKTEVLESIFLLQNEIVVIMVPIALLLLLLEYILITPLTGRINKLKIISEKISKGNLEVEMPQVSSNDEISQLAQSFDTMRNEIKKSRNTLESRVTERTQELLQAKKEIEMKNIALTEAQVDLYNINKNLEKIVETRTNEIQKMLIQKDEFINQLSHDLKNPLTPLSVLLPILEKEEENPKNKEMLRTINTNVRYIKNLIIKTIELARLNSPNTTFDMRQTNLLQEVNSVLETNKILFDEKQVQVINNIPEYIAVSADSLKLHELFTNILNNSVKYSEEQVNIIINAVDDDNFIKISIADNGIGATQEQISKIFDEFYKADPSRHDFDSSGLGLPICKRIVEKHGGKIWAESNEPSKGITVYFTLPKTNSLHQGNPLS
jgi:signal transduction histidine kinase